MRKMLLLPLLLALAFAAGGCSKIEKLGGIVNAATTEIANPIGDRQLIALEATHGAAVTVAVNYRRYCYSKPLAELPQAVCGNRRGIVRTLQAAKDKSRQALDTAIRFVADNPRISAVSLIAAAKQAVTDFQGTTAPYAAVQ